MVFRPPSRPILALTVFVLVVLSAGAACAFEPEPGVVAEVSATVDSYANLQGGLAADGVIHSIGAFSVGLTFDLEALRFWSGGSFTIIAQQSRGRAISEKEVGALQYVSSIEAPEFTQVGEYYLEQSVAGGVLRLKLGKQDSNADFCAPEFAADFANCSFATVPNVPMTTYPDAGLGLAVFARALPWLEIGAGVYDGDAVGTDAGFISAFDGEGGGFQIVELRARPGGADSGADRGAYRLGLWRHTEDVLQITDEAEYYEYSQNHGLYVELDQPLWRRADREEFAGLGAFIQYGWAPGDRNEIRNYFGGGLTWRGALPGRGADVMGLGVASAHLCRQLRWLEGTTGETTGEMFYRAQLTPWLAVQPDLQYVVNPGGAGENALAVGLRLDFGI
jgi:porin